MIAPDDDYDPNDDEIKRDCWQCKGEGWMCWATMDITHMEAESWTGRGDPFTALVNALTAAQEAEHAS